jgi:hypothetical protein
MDDKSKELEKSDIIQELKERVTELENKVNYLLERDKDGWR